MNTITSLTVAIDIDGVIAPVTTPDVLAELPASIRPWSSESYLEVDVMFGTLVAAPVRDLLREFDEHSAVRPM